MREREKRLYLVPDASANLRLKAGEEFPETVWGLCFAFLNETN